MGEYTINTQVIGRLATKIKSENDANLLDLIERLHLVQLEFNLAAMKSPRLKDDLQAFNQCVHEIEIQSKKLDEIYIELINYKKDIETVMK